MNQTDIVMKTLPEVMAEFVNLNKKVNAKPRPWTKREMDNHVQRLNDWFATIQLDAMKEGARRAAEIANTEMAKYAGRQYVKFSEITKPILTTAEQWTEKDL